MPWAATETAAKHATATARAALLDEDMRIAPLVDAANEVSLSLE